MDLGVTAFVLGGIGLLIGYAVAMYRNDKTIVELSQELEEARHEAKKSNKKASKKSTQSSAKDSSKQDLKEAKSEIKKLKKQIYELKEEKKADQQKTTDDSSKKSKKKTADSDAVFALREEIGELKVELAAAQTRANVAEKASAASLKEDSEPVDDDPNDSAEVVELKKTHREELKALRAKATEQEREFKKKLKKTSSNVDKQRRRADNNDKAYKITQRQVDGLQERIAYLEKELRKASFSTASAEAADEAPTVAPTSSASETAEIAVHATPSFDDVSDVEVAPLAVDDASEAVTEPPVSKPVVPELDEPAPGFIMTKEAEPNTIEISEDLADDLLAEADRSDVFEVADEPDRKTMQLNAETGRSTQLLSAVDEPKPGQTAVLGSNAIAELGLAEESSEQSDGANTQLLTPQKLADAGIPTGGSLEDDSQSRLLPRLGDDGETVDDAWSDFDVD